MRNLIEIEQEDLIMCDNSKCDYTIKNETKDPNTETRQYINMPCPKCGENLLTEFDYNQSKSFMKYINFINKWFSWTTIFIRKNKKIKKTIVHIHNGVNIIKDERKTN